MKRAEGSNPKVFLKIVSAIATTVGVAFKGLSNAWVIILATMTVFFFIAHPFLSLGALGLGMALSIASAVADRLKRNAGKPPAESEKE